MRLVSDSLRRRPDSELGVCIGYSCRPFWGPISSKDTEETAIVMCVLALTECYLLRSFSWLRNKLYSVVLTLRWPKTSKALIRGAVRNELHLNCDGEIFFYRALDIGVLLFEEQFVSYAYFCRTFGSVQHLKGVFPRRQPPSLYCLLKPSL